MKLLDDSPMERREGEEIGWRREEDSRRELLSSFLRTKRGMSRGGSATVKSERERLVLERGLGLLNAS